VFYITIGWRLVQSGYLQLEDKTNLVTEDGKQELIDRIKEIINCDFTIMEHFAGVRPTVKDRRPLVGTHAEYSAIHILNGLGTGVMLGPSMAKALYNAIENDILWIPN
jgi:glycine/D-amino acid oxidase-like deaminating enzyme